MPTLPEPDPHVLFSPERGMTSAPSLGEGWQAEGAPRQRFWHYIRGSRSLCGRLAIYRGDIARGGIKPEDHAECASCAILLDADAARW